jgi:hypothetical protein
LRIRTRAAVPARLDTRRLLMLHGMDGSLHLRPDCPWLKLVPSFRRERRFKGSSFWPERRSGFGLN